MRTSRVIPTDTEESSTQKCLANQGEYYRKSFQQSSKLKIAKCLIVHILSRRYYVTRLELGYEWEATEQKRLCVFNNIVLYNVSVNHESMDAKNFQSKCWFTDTSSMHEYSYIVAHISSKYMSQVCTTNC